MFSSTFIVSGLADEQMSFFWRTWVKLAHIDYLMDANLALRKWERTFDRCCYFFAFHPLLAHS
jgi:hypothetical protein